LEEHPEVFNELDTKVREMFKAERAKSTNEPVSEDDEEPEE
jgi:hypothetical protein